MCLNSKIANVWSQIKQINVIFTHLKLCLATATHSFKWVNMYLFNNVAILKVIGLTQ